MSRSESNSPVTDSKTRKNPRPLWFTRKFVSGVFVWLLTIVVLFASTTIPASADTVADEQQFVNLVNGLRSEKGLAPLELDRELRIQARGWSQEMAAKGVLEHSPNLSSGVSADWRLLGENVGVTDSGNVRELFDAFVASPAHYRNLIDPSFQFIGVGVVYGADGKLWTTHRFMAVSNVAVTVPKPPSTQAPSATSPPNQPAAASPVQNPDTNEAPVQGSNGGAQDGEARSATSQGSGNSSSSQSGASAKNPLQSAPDVLVTLEPSALDVDLVANVLTDLETASS